MSRRVDEDNGSASLADVAYDRIRSAIHEHTYQSGDRLRVADLAVWLEISRTPLRDALQRLEAEGLLEGHPTRGLVVATLDSQRVSEIYALRAALEGLASRLAARQATEAEVAMLRRNLSRQEATEPGDTRTHVKLNAQFHRIVFAASRNRYLGASADALEIPLSLLRGTTYAGSDRPNEAFDQHRQLVDAIAERRDHDAETIATAHVRAAERIRLRMIAEGVDRSTD